MKNAKALRVFPRKDGVGKAIAEGVVPQESRSMFPEIAQKPETEFSLDA
jgi:hypothetical protein